MRLNFLGVLTLDILIFSKILALKTLNKLLKRDQINLVGIKKQRFDCSVLFLINKILRGILNRSV